MHRVVTQKKCSHIVGSFLNVGVQARSDCAHLVHGEPQDAHLLGYPLRLASASARDVHLDHGGHEGTADALASLEHVPREYAAGAQLRNAQCQRADAGGEAALAVAVAAVRSDAAHSVGLGVHHGVHNLIGEPSQQLLYVDGAVFGPGHGKHVRCQVW